MKGFCSSVFSQNREHVCFFPHFSFPFPSQIIQILLLCFANSPSPTTQSLWSGSPALMVVSGKNFVSGEMSRKDCKWTRYSSFLVLGGHFDMRAEPEIKLQMFLLVDESIHILSHGHHQSDRMTFLHDNIITWQCLLVDRYRWDKSTSFLYMDVFPPSATTFTVTGLQPLTTYNLSVNALNAMGESVYADNNAVLTITTKGQLRVTPSRLWKDCNVQAADNTWA